MSTPPLLPSAFGDSFVRDNLPPAALMPDCRFDLPWLKFPERLNAAGILDRTARAHGDRVAVIDGARIWTYRDLLVTANRIAGVLAHDMGLVPGNRVLLRSANNAMAAAAWFAILKAGGVAVATMPLLREAELTAIIGKARITHALCDRALAPALEAARDSSPGLDAICHFDSGGRGGDELEALMTERPAEFATFPSSRDDAALIAFTSGTTGAPKATVHFHRDVAAICECMPRHVLRPGPDDVFTGTPPLGFTFGLGGLLLFPVRYGAATVFPASAAPESLLDAVARHRATILFTAPTAYRAMLAAAGGHDLSSLRVTVSSGEHLSASIWQAWKERTGLALAEVMGSTEMLHAYIGANGAAARPNSPGTIVPGYEARIVDEGFADLPDGETGRLLVRGPTGCRYLADHRQADQVRDGWTITGDLMSRGPDGYFRFSARADDMIVSAGYNISGTEVEDVLLRHEAVRECVVIGQPDEARGMVAMAIVVVAAGFEPGPALASALQDHVKAAIAPYKYPRRVEFVAELPRTATGKLSRRPAITRM
jgi:2-aminobenzoate-CoA ligase